METGRSLAYFIFWGIFVLNFFNLVLDVTVIAIAITRGVAWGEGQVVGGPGGSVPGAQNEYFN